MDASRLTKLYIQPDFVTNVILFFFNFTHREIYADFYDNLFIVFMC
jgi:hypothetical protein